MFGRYGFLLQKTIEARFQPLFGCSRGNVSSTAFKDTQAYWTGSVPVVPGRVGVVVGGGGFSQPARKTIKGLAAVPSAALNARVTR